MDAHLPDIYFKQYLPETRDIKSTHILPNVYLINALPPKTRDIKWTHICRMSTLINALPRKLMILN